MLTRVIFVHDDETQVVVKAKNLMCFGDDDNAYIGYASEGSRKVLMAFPTPLATNTEIEQRKIVAAANKALKEAQEKQLTEAANDKNNPVAEVTPAISIVPSKSKKAKPSKV